MADLANAQRNDGNSLHFTDESGIDAASLINRIYSDLPVEERLSFLSSHIEGEIIFTTSFGLEDQALTHLIQRSGIACRLVTLDTGRLFPETYNVWAETERRYEIRVEGYYPRAEAVASLTRAIGVNGFYHSAEARHACCGARKIEPLNRALQGARVWLTGLRAEQSGNRAGMGFAAWDGERRLLKVNPLLDWSRDQVVAFVRAENVPYNALHDQGFLSIGCAPCTRAVAPGEPERAGRWWWEQDQTRECGLHVAADGKLVRARAD